MIYRYWIEWDLGLNETLTSCPHLMGALLSFSIATILSPEISSTIRDNLSNNFGHNYVDICTKNIPKKVIKLSIRQQ